MSCPPCGESARFVDYRDRTFRSLVGDIRFGRAYDHCKPCAAGHMPWDQALRVSLKSAGSAA